MSRSWKKLAIDAGTDRGFSLSYNIVRCHPSVQWAKLEALVEGARMASKALWGR
jgi:5-methyltetrahydropteroyltriglutamate--homocysteine methyltransferase